ncbi:MAG: MBL fold metallo-hydrolase [Bacteroidaceae bacterium]|nr:MBL fold metallo-hydrolase [Bacteroidaceae bacterium]
MDRRNFLKAGGAAIAAAAAAQVSPAAAQGGRRGRSGFTMWQLNTQCNQIGNSYVFLTDRGRVIVMDGGHKDDEYYLRGFLARLGNKVDTWFISHPHIDHMGSLSNIMVEPRGITIRRIIHSRFNEALIQSEDYCVERCRMFYERLDAFRDAEVIDLQQAGMEESIDGFHFRILGVSNREILQNGYNNSSVVIKVCDRRKSILFLGDAGVECGRKLLANVPRSDLDSDYMQMAHHGQNGCDRQFYDTVDFRACLWSTPKWVWENDFGQGPGSGKLKTFETRAWMDEKGIREHHVSWMGLWQLD